MSLLLGVVCCLMPSLALGAEEDPIYLAQATTASQADPDLVDKFELDTKIRQVQAENRASRDLTEVRINVMEKGLEQSKSYVENLLFTFMIAGGIVVFIVLATLNKQTGLNNEKMRNLIREAEHSLAEVNRLIDRPEAENFHVSRKLTRIMNAIRENDKVYLPQKDIGDIHAAAQDPTLPVTLHLQANALKEEQAGSVKNAIVLWERLLEVDTSNPEVLLRLAQNYKKLSETSIGNDVIEFRKTSLEYFQQYSVNTNQFMESARELRHRLGMDPDMPKTLESKIEVEPAGYHITPAQSSFASGTENRTGDLSSKSSSQDFHSHGLENEITPASFDSSTNGDSENPSVADQAGASTGFETTSIASNNADSDLIKSFNSRLEKAKEFCDRLRNAKKFKDGLRWFELAEIEFKVAENYHKNLELYQHWGGAVLEVAKLDSNNAEKWARQGIEILGHSDDDDINDGMLNELALFYAIVNREEDCRKVLEKAHQAGKLDTSMHNDFPQMGKFKNQFWYQNLAA